MNKLQSYFIASVLYVMTPHAFAQGTVTIYLPGEQQTLSVGPVENVVQLVTQPQTARSPLVAWCLADRLCGES